MENVKWKMFWFLAAGNTALLPPANCLFLGLRRSKMFSTDSGYRYVGSTVRHVTVFEEASIISLLPNREPRTGSPPSFDHFCVRPGLGTNPLKQIQNQAVYGVLHDSVCVPFA